MTLIEDNLEYRIGGLDDPDFFCKEDPKSHRFIVEAVDKKVSIYVSVDMGAHDDVAARFNIPIKREVGEDNCNIVGGGYCYLNSEGQLVLDDYSYDYGAIPKNVALKFAELMIPELKKSEIEVNGVAVNPYQGSLNRFWRDLGFGSGDQ